MEFKIHTSLADAVKRRTQARIDLSLHIKPKNLLRWEYLQSALPASKLHSVSPFVLKAAVDGAYHLPAHEAKELEDLAGYVARLPDFKLKRLGENNKFVKLVRTKRKHYRGVFQTQGQIQTHAHT